ALAADAATGTTARRPRDLKAVAPDAPKILLHNVYGWFTRVERGVYALTEAGRAALVRWEVAAAPESEPPTIGDAGQTTMAIPIGVLERGEERRASRLDNLVAPLDRVSERVIEATKRQRAPRRKAIST